MTDSDHPTPTPRRLRDRWRSPRDMRIAGRLMVALGVVGALVAVFGTVVGWIFVGQVATASDDSLDLTIQTLDAVDDTIDLADEVLVATADAVGALAGTLDAVSDSFDTGTQAIVDVAGLADTLGPSLENATATVRNLERLGGTIDGVLGALSSLPIGPDYDPESGLEDTFGQLADTLEELPDQLASTSQSLTDFTGSAGGLQARLDQFASSVASISTDIAGTGELVDQYRASVADARALALETNDDLDTGVILVRILLLAGGITLLLGQVVPLWLGRSLLDDADRLEGTPTVP
jgi:methyl-accepting chemotaxis protein